MSSFRDRYKKQKQDLLRRHEESVKDKGESKFGSILDMSKVPKTVNFWRCADDKHTIDIIPFIAGDRMPRISGANSEGRVKEGQLTWVVDLYVHWNVGVLKHPYICPAYTNGKPCPICEDLQNRRDEMTKVDYDNAKAKRRVMYLVWCHDNSAEENKGIQIWEVAHYFMEYNLKEISERPKGGGTVLYFDLDTGKNVLFTKRGKGAGNVEFIGHRFEDRDAPIPDKILDQSFSLDEALIYPSYNELHALYYGEEYEEHSEKDEGNTYSVPEEEKPAGRDPEMPFDDGPIEDDGENFDPMSCPVGGEFGVDCDQLEDCTSGDGCRNWDNCYSASQEMAEQQAEPAPEPEPPPTPVRRAPVRREPVQEEAPPERKPKPALRRRA